MNSIRISAKHDQFSLKQPFRISRGARTTADVITVTATREKTGLSGYAEALPYTHYGETIDSVLAQITAAADKLGSVLTRENLQNALPAGAARNAMDCALWDLQCRESGLELWDRLAIPKPVTINTAITIGVGSAAAMAEQARILKHCAVLKIKLDKENVRDKILQIRANAPDTGLIIDPNESWDITMLRELDPFLADQGIAMLEQPLPAGQDDGLIGFNGRVPLCADESCHTAADLAALQNKYHIINIKLDKSGGLTEALRLKQQARDLGFDIMVGCMMGTSLAIAPALVLAHNADFVDLDGPVWIADDREPKLLIEAGVICLRAAN